MKKIPYIPILFTLMLLFGLAVIALRGYYWVSFEQDKPQPIAFSHQKHVSQFGLECTKCHLGTDRSPMAGYPDTAICMECHEQAGTDKADIQKLTQYHRQHKPVPWVKIHDSGWHVHFNHKRHIKKGIQCTSCHGRVEMMEVMRKVGTLEMGWCVNCHNQRSASKDCLTCHK